MTATGVLAMGEYQDSSANTVVPTLLLSLCLAAMLFFLQQLELHRHCQLPGDGARTGRQRKTAVLFSLRQTEPHCFAPSV